MSKKIQLVVAGSVFLGLILVWIGWRHGRTEADEGASSAGNSREVTAGCVVRVAARYDCAILDHRRSVSSRFRTWTFTLRSRDTSRRSTWT